MRGSKCKKLRRAVYGDLASNSKGRPYVIHKDSGVVLAHAPRRVYQHFKRGFRGKQVNNLQVRFHEETPT